LLNFSYGHQKNAFNFVEVSGDAIEFENVIWKDLLCVTKKLEFDLRNFDNSAIDDIITLWSHVFAPLLRAIARHPQDIDEMSPRQNTEDIDGVSYTTAILLAKDRYPPIATWPHELKSLSYLIRGNISETDLNSLDKHADILLCNFDKETWKALVDRILATKTVSLRWQQKICESKIKHGELLPEHKHKLVLGEKAVYHKMQQMAMAPKPTVLHQVDKVVSLISSLFRFNK